MRTQDPATPAALTPASLARACTPLVVLPGAAGLVWLSHTLGTRWLANPAVGLPAGAWIVILATAAAKLVTDERRQADRSRLPAPQTPPNAAAHPPHVLAPLISLARRTAAAAVRALDRALRTDFEGWFAAARDSITWADHPRPRRRPPAPPTPHSAPSPSRWPGRMTQAPRIVTIRAERAPTRAARSKHDSDAPRARRTRATARPRRRAPARR